MSWTLQWSLSGHQCVCISNSHEAITMAAKDNLKWKTFVCVFQMILLTKIKKILMSVLGLNSKAMKSTRDTANISNPKVNRGYAPLTANRISADCVQISLGPPIPYISLGVYHTMGFNATLHFHNYHHISQGGNEPKDLPNSIHIISFDNCIHILLCY